MAAKSAFRKLVFPELFCPMRTVRISSSTSTDRRQRKCLTRTSLMKIPLDAGGEAVMIGGAAGVLTAAISLRLEAAVARELQCAAVLRDRPHDVVRSSCGDLRFD